MNLASSGGRNPNKNLCGWKLANASRKTINRTGNRGVNGVRDHLRVVLGRSPDPDEIYVEAHRPKGCIGTKKKTITPKWGDLDGEEESEGDGRNDSAERSPSKLCNDDGVERISQLTNAHQVCSVTIGSPCMQYFHYQDVLFHSKVLMFLKNLKKCSSCKGE